MKKAVFVSTLFLASAALVAGHVYAAYTITDNASSLSAQIRLSPLSFDTGYYLVGDETFTGSTDKWSVSSGRFMGASNPSITLDIANGAEVKIIHYDDAAHSIDVWLDAPASSYSCVQHENAGDNLVFVRSSNYTISLNAENKIEIVDNNQIVEERKYYLEFEEAGVYSLSDGIKQDDSTDSGNLANWKNVVIEANKKARIVYSADGYAETTVYSVLGSSYYYANQGSGYINISRASTYSIYLSEAEGNNLYIADEVATPYVAGGYYMVKNGVATISESVGDSSDHAKWTSNVSIHEGDVITFAHSENAYTLTGSVTLGRAYDFASINGNEITFTRSSGSYQIYWNGSDEIWISDPTLPVAGYYFEAGTYNVYANTSSRLGTKEVGNGDVFKVADYDGFSTTAYLDSLADSYEYASISNGVVTITGSSTYNVSVSGGKIIIEDTVVPVPNAGYYILLNSDSYAWSSGIRMSDTGLSNENNLAELTSQDISAGEKIKIAHFDGTSETPDATYYTLGETLGFASQESEAIAFSKTNSYNFYLDKNGTLWVNIDGGESLSGYYLTYAAGSYGIAGATKLDDGPGDNHAVEKDLVIAAGNAQIKYYDGLKDTLGNALPLGSSYAFLDGNSSGDTTIKFKKYAVYNIYVNSSDTVYITYNIYFQDKAWWASDSATTKVIYNKTSTGGNAEENMTLVNTDVVNSAGGNIWRWEMNPNDTGWLSFKRYNPGGNEYWTSECQWANSAEFFTQENSINFFTLYEDTWNTNSGLNWGFYEL